MILSISLTLIRAIYMLRMIVKLSLMMILISPRRQIGGLVSMWFDHIVFFSVNVVVGEFKQLGQSSRLLQANSILEMSFSEALCKYSPSNCKL